MPRTGAGPQGTRIVNDEPPALRGRFRLEGMENGMMLRGLCMAMLMGVLGASAPAVPMPVQSTGVEPVVTTPDPANARGDARQPRRKVVRRCARRSRLGICERWNMPKSSAPVSSDSRKPATKH